MAPLVTIAAVALLFFSSMANAQFFDQQGLALLNIESPTDPRIGWKPVSALTSKIYNGVGALTSMPSRDGYFCSGSLIVASQKLNAPVYILTNGHCIAFERFLAFPKLIIKDEKPSGSDFFLSKPFFDSLKTEQLMIPFKKISYASLDGLDIALVETFMSLREARQNGLKVYVLSRIIPKSGQKVFSVGIPLVGMPKKKVFAYRSDCRFGESVSLVEGPFKFDKAWPNNCTLVTGQSGSPIFDVVSGEIVAIQATGIDEKQDSPSCELNSPCEVITDGSLRAHSPSSYGFSTHILSNCFQPSGEFDLNLEECDLRKR